MPRIHLQDVTVTLDRVAGEGARQSVADQIERLGADRHVPEALLDWPRDAPIRPHVLDCLTLSIRDGEILTVVGPSGCGKSTLLHVIAGLQPISAGQVFFDDRDMQEVAPKDRHIGMVFQNYALYPHMDAYDNIGFPLRLSKRREEIPERVRQVSEITGIELGRLVGRKPRQLSGGERQRVAIGRCIAREPRVFLLDEPLSNLDAKMRTRVRVEIKRLIKHFNVTSVYVTHDQSEAIALGDRIAVMNEGRIEQVNTLPVLYARPANRFVAGFIGLPPMNFLNCVVDDEGGLRYEGNILVSSGELGRRLIPGWKISLGFRADDLHLAPDGPLRGEVVLVEPLLAEHAQLVYLRVGEVQIAVRLDAEPGIHVGERLMLRLDPSAVHLFSTQSGERLN